MKKCTPKSKGFTLIELLVVIVIIGILTAAFMPKAISAWNESKLNTMVEEVSEIIKASQEAYGRKASYAGLAMSQIKTIVPTGIGDGVGKNPWGGNYTVAPGTPASNIVVTITAIPASLGPKAALKYTTATYTSASGTLSITFAP